MTPEEILLVHPEVDAFLKYYVDNNRATSSNTIFTYRKEVINFLIHCHAEFSGFHMADMKLAHYAAYHRYLLAFKTRRGKHYAANSLTVMTSIVRMFLRWLKYTDQISEEIVFPREFLHGVTSHEMMDLLTPQDIFLIRKQRDILVEDALVLELGLCTGMRISEMLQLRMCDILWEKKPMDEIEGTPSPYVSGTIYLYKKAIKTKRRRSRVAYLSRLAGKLLRSFMEKYDLEENSQAPLFPCTHRALGYGFDCMVDAVIDRNRCNTEASQIRTPGHLELESGELGNPHYQAKLKKIQDTNQEKQDKLPEYAKQINDLPMTGTGVLRPFVPHGMRHCYACFMYYRNFHGERRNIHRLSAEMGHISFQSTQTYLNHFSLVNTDTTWKMLWMGTMQDWRMLS